MKIQSSKLGIIALSLTISIALLLTTPLNTASASKNSDFRLSQSLKQHSVCAEDSVCSNSGINVAEMVKGLKQKIYTKVNQQLKQHNLCVDSNCLNEGYNQFTIDKLKGKFSGKFNQKIEQSNECVNSQCINEGANEIAVNGNGNGNGKVDSQQTIVQTNQCADGATCINSAGNVYVIGNLKKTG
jgi:hypothetical protein